ncbi:MarR family transcriptional regulator [Halohasta litorea]|uniref:MarR family transcriptional regulator n=1 Tax=Halohasta litorea TaxID=869891 RepID=A0ABD6DBG6_9EURY|nr:helix-turn-helix domain-containing protein [Halohasta litorea]
MSTANESVITTTAEMWDAVSDLPPSAKLIAKVLEYNGTLTQSELVERSRLSPRTTRQGTQKLEDAGVVESEISLADARQKLYSLKIEP